MDSMEISMAQESFRDDGGLDSILSTIKEQGKEVLKQALIQQRNLERAIRFKSEIINKREIIRKQLIDFNNAHVDEELRKTFTNSASEDSLEYQEELLKHHHERLESAHDLLQEELDRQAMIMEQLSKTRHELKNRKDEIEDLDKEIRELKGCPEFANKKLLFSTINRILNVSYKNNGTDIQGVYQKNQGTFGVSKFIRKEEDKPEAFDNLMQEALERHRSE